MIAQRNPAGALRLVFRLPLALYRLHLGWLLGRRFLLLTHRGRHSGLLRQTVLEVIHYDEASSESLVVAAWGERADWYRNIQASPPLEVETGSLRYLPAHRRLTPDEAAIALAGFVRSHPLEARLVGPLLGWHGLETEAGRRELAQSVCLVAFRPALAR